jgi:hypothetical protein
VGVPSGSWPVLQVFQVFQVSQVFQGVLRVRSGGDATRWGCVAEVGDDGTACPVDAHETSTQPRVRWTALVHPA